MAKRRRNSPFAKPSTQDQVRQALAQLDYIVSGGSIDSICTTAAVLRNAKRECGIEFCQSFSVDRIDPSAWPPGRRVLLVGLAVNNRDEMMTAEFLRRVAAAGHTIIGVLDEHRAEDWVTAFSRASLRSSRLAIKPVTGRKAGIRSAGFLLLSLMGNGADDHTRELCEAADAADRMNFDTHFGSIVNSAVKPDRHDDSRRIYLARHLSTNREPDTLIHGWMKEYAEILHNHTEILAARNDLGDGMVRIVTYGRLVDMTSLLMPCMHWAIRWW